ncbi:Inosine-uridine preferring nucleoside hydrolase [hydrothermal vent metagenome]|uniref:Inosine-uridine preferring nucleoside hydrolase n=1 Tax=hydrothermal vent metagenome TaxID=652676 RepID=A0A3B0SG44_9ZZZZ
MPSHTIIIDTDPGQDDAVAIMLALASPELNVLAVTAVAGNVPLHRTEMNARMVVESSGRPDIPVYAGAVRPLLRELVTAEYVHGPTGIDGADLPEPTIPLAEGHAVQAIIRHVHDSPDPVTICPLGPLTNVALALLLDPSIAGNINQIVLMGGGYFAGGNVTPAAEFNIYVDPHAAEIVFTSGIDIVMLPLDVTHKALVTADETKRFADLGNRCGAAVAGMIGFYERYDIEKLGSKGAPIHDPNVIAYLLKPEMYGGRRCHVVIETATGASLGATQVDWWGVTGCEPNALVLQDVDSDGFFDLLVEGIARLP